MSAASIYSAVESLYDTLAFVPKPSQIWLGTAPLKDSDGASVTLPCVEMYMEQAPGQVTLEYQPIIDWDTRFEIWASTEADCEAVAYGILYGGQAPNAHAGFAYGTLAIDAPWEFMSMEMISFPMFEKINSSRTAEAVPVYKGTFRMLIKVYRAS